MKKISWKRLRDALAANYDRQRTYAQGYTQGYGEGLREAERLLRQELAVLMIHHQDAPLYTGGFTRAVELLIKENAK